ncbi:hypothetical protein Q4512_00505 [Oceanihabitans sp. 2_MG-2023]|uniref:DUF7793 family protein n=1 Tax=Oceanihabitans sp. 2_MG-2023 TaxID=3062661 RepID=UPI0026E1F533|nr:hypothetical protein [Oceanihabitans sp. 2_MG-2023]MDO6595370.1 hypothetical protein [Oceanihabitans sp. 2_MG-2023]
MKNEIFINNIKFWVDQNIIYCKLFEDSNLNYSRENIESMFCEAISILSNGTFLPVIFDFEELNSSHSLRFFKIISNNYKIKSAVLSKVFLIKNYRQKLLLSFYVLFSDSNVPNLIFRDLDLAIAYCNENYATFNSLSYDH